MWKLTIHTSEGTPRSVVLKPGENVIGRANENEVFIDDNFASRRHALIFWDARDNHLTLTDAGSSNGTYLNRQRLQSSLLLAEGDTIRIGKCSLVLTAEDTDPIALLRVPGTFHTTGELLLRAMDRNATALSEAARELNTMLDLRSALYRVSELMKQAMSADRCAVILPDKFNQVDRLGFPRSVAEMVVRQRSAVIIPDMNEIEDRRLRQSGLLHQVHSALCVPILNGADLLGLILLSKNSANELPFNESDLEMAVGISHQAALTIQRMHLVEDLKGEQQIQSLLRRFVSPTEAGQLFQYYSRTGELPEMEESEHTVLFADMAESTRLAEQLGPQAFAKLLREYYSTAIQVVFAQRGIIKLLGDGVMAIFGPVAADDPPEVRATFAGLGLLEGIRMYNEQNPQQMLEIGVGVTTGLVVSGYVGSQGWMEYTAVGDTVNTAARLQNYARPNRLVVDARTAASITSRFSLNKIGVVEIRGREQLLHIFEVFSDLSEFDLFSDVGADTSHSLEDEFFIK